MVESLMKMTKEQVESINQSVAKIHSGIIITDENGHIMFKNALADLFMSNLEEVYKAKGQPLFSILSPYLSLEALLKEKQAVTDVQIPIKRVDYRLDCYPIVNTCDKDQLILVIRDLNQLDTIVEKINSHLMITERLDRIIEHSYDGIYITDGAGKTLKINAAYERLTGLNRSNLLDHYMDELVEKGYISQSGSILAIKNKKTYTLNQTFKTGKKALITSKPVFDEKGNIVLVVTNVRDVTELYHLKNQLEEQTELTNKYYHEAISLKNQILETGDIVAEDKVMIDALEMAQRVAITDASVALSGESGVGKEVVAKFIHSHSLRSQGHFIKVNCGAIPENLIESEFFGYEKGAYTGANKEGKPGLFELADQGTLFLDEIGELPLNMQVKLLRVLQEGELMRIGGTKTIQIDVRIISATNRDLGQMVKAKEFRKDLFYRLNVVPITIAPLRERQNDLVKLTHVFLQTLNDQYHMRKKMDYEVMDCFLNYPWPGNIRELKNVISRMMIMCPEEDLTISYIPRELQLGDNKKQNRFLNQDNMTLKEAVNLLEKQMIEKAYSEYGNVRQAAKSLGIDASTFVRKRNKLNQKE